MNHYATVIADAGAARLLMAELLGTDPGILTPVLLLPNVNWFNIKFDFVVYENCDNNLYTLGWFPAPSTRKCIRCLNAAACQYITYKYGGWPSGLESTIVAVTEDALAPTPIAHMGLSCNGTVLEPASGQEILLCAGSSDTRNLAIDEFLAVLREKDVIPATELGRATKAALERS